MGDIRFLELASLPQYQGKPTIDDWLDFGDFHDSLDVNRAKVADTQRRALQGSIFH